MVRSCFIYVLLSNLLHKLREVDLDLLHRLLERLLRGLEVLLTLVDVVGRRVKLAKSLPKMAKGGWAQNVVSGNVGGRQAWVAPSHRREKGGRSPYNSGRVGSYRRIAKENASNVETSQIP